MPDQAVVVALGQVDPALVAGVLGDGVSFVPDPGAEDLAVAVGAIARADAVVDAAFLDRAPRLRVVARTGVGVDLVDLEAASARGVGVVVTPGSGTRAVAEGVLAMALHLVKRLGRLTSLVRNGGWAERSRVPVGDLDGATLGIVGYVRIGRRVGELAAASDVLTLHAPLTPATHHLVDAALLARARPGAILVNCGRGGLLDLDAALAALESGRLGGIGLDVFDPEPPPHHPLFDTPTSSSPPT
jgi:D-3-phosphoglycerate dehydrogenase